MGLLKRVKCFFNIEGVKIEGVELKKTLFLEESEISGSYDIVAGSDSVVLSTIHTFYVERATVDEEGNETFKEIEIAIENSEEIAELAAEYPFEIKKREKRRMHFHLKDIDIEKVLNEVGEYNMGKVVDDHEIAFFVKIEVDIKGTPFDPEVKTPVKVALAECGKV